MTWGGVCDYKNITYCMLGLADSNIPRADSLIIWLFKAQNFIIESSLTELHTQLCTIIP